MLKVLPSHARRATDHTTDRATDRSAVRKAVEAIASNGVYRPTTDRYFDVDVRGK